MIVMFIGFPRSMTGINRSELTLQPLTASVFKPLHFFFVISGVAHFVAARRGRSRSRPFQFTNTEHCNVQTPLFLPRPCVSRSTFCLQAFCGGVLPFRLRTAASGCPQLWASCIINNNAIQGCSLLFPSRQS